MFLESVRHFSCVIWKSGMYCLFDSFLMVSMKHIFITYRNLVHCDYFEYKTCSYSLAWWDIPREGGKNLPRKLGRIYPGRFFLTNKSFQKEEKFLLQEENSSNQINIERIIPAGIEDNENSSLKQRSFRRIFWPIWKSKTLSHPALLYKSLVWGHLGPFSKL